MIPGRMSGRLVRHLYCDPGEGRTTRPMRILIVNKYAYVMGGADRYCAMLTEGMRARGHEVEWLALRQEVNAERAGAFVARMSGPRLVPRALWNRPAAGAMGALIERFRPDVVNSHMLYPYLSVAPLVVARRRRVPVVHTLHSYELLSAGYARESGGWIDRDGTRRTDRVLNTLTFPVRRLVHPRLVDEFIAVSDYVAEAHARCGIRAHVVTNATDAVTGPGPGFESRRGIVFAGRLVNEKGVLDVLDVARRLPDIPVTVCGAGPLFRLVREAAMRLPNVEAPGWIASADMPAMLRRARVLVMPSRCAETSGLAALEALACGTPVVSYPAGGLTDVVERSGGGRVVAVDGLVLASACAELHEDRSVWEAHSRSGLEAVSGPFSKAAWLDGIEAVYRRALDQRCASRPSATARAG
jgi:glycosyltransferase involved in cell wall biosynthesis